MRKPVDIESVNAFGTPTVVNFGGALALSAIMCVPWSSPGAASVVLTGCGIAGLAYAVVVLRRARRQKDYRPVAADWVWYVILPSGLYAALVLGGIMLWKSTASALFVLGAVALGLLLIGVRNAWDSVTHIVVSELGKGEK